MLLAEFASIARCDTRCAHWVGGGLSIETTRCELLQYEHLNKEDILDMWWMSRMKNVTRRKYGFTVTSTMVVNGSLVVARGLVQGGERCRSFCRMTQECFKLLGYFVVWVSRKWDVGAWTGSS